MKVAAVIQARMGSTRLPGKVLKEIKGKPVLYHIIERLKGVKSLDDIIVATSSKEQDREIIDFCRRHSVNWFSGSETDLLERYIQAAEKYEAENVIRILADCPVVDPGLINTVIELHMKSGSDLTTNTQSGLLPIGTGATIVKTEVLEELQNVDLKPYHREHVTVYIYENPDKYKILHAPIPEELVRPDYRLTLDTEEDWSLIKAIYDRLYKPGEIFSLSEIINTLDSEPGLLKINQHVKQKQANSG